MPHYHYHSRMQRAPPHQVCLPIAWSGVWLHCKTVCPSGLRGWTQVPLARAAWVQIPQLSMAMPQTGTHSYASSSHVPQETRIRRASVSVHIIATRVAPHNTCSGAAGASPQDCVGAHTAHRLCGGVAGSHHIVSACCTEVMTLAGLEPAIFGSEDQRLIH